MTNKTKIAHVGLSHPRLRTGRVDPPEPVIYHASADVRDFFVREVRGGVRNSISAWRLLSEKMVAVLLEMGLSKNPWCGPLAALTLDSRIRKSYRISRMPVAVSRARILRDRSGLGECGARSAWSVGWTRTLPVMHTLVTRASERTFVQGQKT